MTTQDALAVAQRLRDIDKQHHYHQRIADAETIEALCAEVERLTAVDVEPVVISEPDYNYEAMGCGLEDQNIKDRYEAMRHGWDCAVERMLEQVPDEPLYPVSALAASREQHKQSLLRIEKEVDATLADLAAAKAERDTLRTQLAALQADNQYLLDAVKTAQVNLNEVTDMKNAEIERLHKALEGIERSTYDAMTAILARAALENKHD